MPSPFDQITLFEKGHFLSHFLILDRHELLYWSLCFVCLVFFFSDDSLIIKMCWIILSQRGYLSELPRQSLSWKRYAFHICRRCCIPCKPQPMFIYRPSRALFSFTSLLLRSRIIPPVTCPLSSDPFSHNSGENYCRKIINLLLVKRNMNRYEQIPRSLQTHMSVMERYT